ncbi:MAG: peptidoglycan D,D-transpeptidase FtsI family protein [Ktedonobacteraceae bacterium]
MNGEMQRARRRQMFIFLLVTFGMLVLLARLYYWQVLQSHSGYNLAQQANEEHLQNQILDAPRGLIYDSAGRILASNIIRDDVYIEPVQFSVDHPNGDTQGELQTLIGALHGALPFVSIDTLQKAFSDGMAQGLWAERVAVRITPAQSQTLRNLQLPDVFLQPRTWRVYPAGTLASQILGFVTQNDTGNAGMYGIEKQYNSLLQGTPGSLTAETDLQGNPLTLGGTNEQPAVSGANLTLTIDSNVQYMVENALANAVKQLNAMSGTVVILNARTGAVVSMAGYPTFDPNQYGQYANQLGCENQAGVYFNPAIYCVYEPGSTMKAVTMSAGLDTGLITPDTTLDDQGCMSFSDAAQVCNWEDLSYGTETMTGVLIHSANVGAAYVAHNILHTTHYYPYLQKFGFGQPTGIADGQENPGSYRQPGNPTWSISDLTRQAFGEAIYATPLQVALVYQTIANGGIQMQPYVVASIQGNGHNANTQPVVKRRVISANAAQLLTGMLEQAATKGFAQLAQVPGYSIAAKTGTATTIGLSDDQTVASVAGFIPASNPKFVILVKLDRPQNAIYGSTAAAPLWGYIAQQLMWYYNVPPDLPL